MKDFYLSVVNFTEGSLFSLPPEVVERLSFHYKALFEKEFYAAQEIEKLVEENNKTHPSQYQFMATANSSPVTIPLLSDTAVSVHEDIRKFHSESTNHFYNSHEE